MFDNLVIAQVVSLPLEQVIALKDELKVEN